MVKVELKFDHVRPALGNFLGYAIGRWAGREFQVRMGRRIANLGEFGGLALTAVGGLAQFVRDYQYEEDVRRLASGFALAGLDDAIKVYVYDEPIAWFTDANSLVIRNLGAYSGTAGDWTVLVDGSGVTVSSVEGDASKATLHLGTAVTKGKHDVVVILKGAKKAFSGKLVVP
jgi:hypothetical protein